jgi:hypothetical protein
VITGRRGGVGLPDKHSAGSGKSNTIAWTAHRLSSLHDADDRKVFDKVVVITDRVILDEQLQETISTTLGPERITYWEYSKGHYIPYQPHGIQLPRQCPNGGFQFAAAFTFENGLHAYAHAVVRCPAGRAGSVRAADS